jgi:peptide deformylase
MTQRNLVVVPSSQLTIPTREITEIEDFHISLAEDMKRLMYLYRGVGLAANQIGESLSLIVIDVDYPLNKGQFKPRIFLNPKIVSSYGSNHLVEGCLSVPGLRLDLVRPAEVIVKAQDISGKEVEFEAKDMLARVIQHEIDHLEGTNIFEALTREQKSSYLKHIKK